MLSNVIRPLPLSHKTAAARKPLPQIQATSSNTAQVTPKTQLQHESVGETGEALGTEGVAEGERYHKKAMTLLRGMTSGVILCVLVHAHICW